MVHDADTQPENARDGVPFASTHVTASCQSPSHRRAFRWGGAILVIALVVAIMASRGARERSSKHAGVARTLPAMLTLLYLMDDQQDPALDEFDDARWTILTPSQGNAILAASTEYGGLDFDQSAWTEEGILVDPWGQAYGIAVQALDGYREFTAWSPGADGKIGTPDDIVRPFGRGIPGFDEPKNDCL